MSVTANSRWRVSVTYAPQGKPEAREVKHYNADGVVNATQIMTRETARPGTKRVELWARVEAWERQ